MVGSTPGNLIQTQKLEKVEKLLDGENQIAAISLSPGIIENGSKKTIDEGTLYIGPADKIAGKYWQMNQKETQELIEESPLETPYQDTKEERNEAGFYIGNQSGFPYEVKLDESLPEYPEWPPHIHNVDEEYVPINGSINLGVPGPSFPENEEEAVKLLENIEDPSQESIQENYPGLFEYEEIETPYKVPAGVPHYIEDADPETDLIIARGDTEEQVERFVPLNGEWQASYPDSDMYGEDVPMIGYNPR